MPKDAAICKGKGRFLSDLCKRRPVDSAYPAVMTGTRKAELLLKPVLIGFVLGLALVGASRLASPEKTGPQLTAVQAHLQAHGAAIGHVSAPANAPRPGASALI
jgi:hypothetical protein